MAGKVLSLLLQGKVPIDTGGNSGIGVFIVEYRAKLDAKVLID